MPCMIENLSDGGALLAFEEAAPLAGSFRLIVDETSFNLLCEPRHAQGNRLGVKFARLAEGIALNRHFQKATVEPDAFEPPDRAEARGPVAAAMSVRELRSKVMAQTDADGGDEPRELTAAEMLASGCLPPGLGFVSDGSRYGARRPPRIVRPVPDPKAS